MVTIDNFFPDVIPKDKYQYVYWVVYYIGLIILLPWNILITVNGYWDYKFRNVSVAANETSQTELQKVCG